MTGSLFKVAFQNVRTINKEKVVRLNNFLKNVDVIFLSEVDNPSFRFISNDHFQYHYDPSTCRRLAVISSNLVDMQPIGPGLILHQDRVQKDKTAVQTYLYQITINVNKQKHVIHFENVYSIPSLSPLNKERLHDHLSDRPLQFKNFVVGGDFNLNWLSVEVRNLFESVGGMTQQVHEATRVCEYEKIINGTAVKKKSESIIDLIFTSRSILPKCKKVYAKKIPKESSDKSATFDHKAVICELNFPCLHYYREITYYPNPHNRPPPTEKQIKLISSEISKIDTLSLTSFDDLNQKTRVILDDVIPNNPPGPKKKRLYRTPFSKQLIKEIRLKHDLDKRSHRSLHDLSLYRKQRNKCTALVRAETRDYQNKLFEKANSVGQIQNIVKSLESDIITNISGNADKIEFHIDEKLYSGLELAEKAGEFFENRATGLVTDQQISDAGLPGPVLKDDEHLPAYDFLFPLFHNLYDFIPKNKISNSAGPSKIASSIIEKVWDSFEPKLNFVCQRFNLSYPVIDQGYFQRLINKVPNPKRCKDFRPIGVLNAIEKYCFNKPFFKSLRKHLEPIFHKRNNFSYKGTHLCIIKTLDQIQSQIWNELPTLLVKYDFSNAFGTTHPETIMIAFSQLNLSDSCLNYIRGYIHNQADARTIISDKTGYYTSKNIPMTRGNPQGQVGADLVFLVQQLVLREIENVFRTLYVDDINDVHSGETELATVMNALANEFALKEQVVQVGFMLNADKTTYIPFNIQDQTLLDNGILPINIKRDSCVLGFSFDAKSKGVDISPAAQSIITKLRKKRMVVHAARNYVTDIDILVKTARTLIYHCIGDLHLVVGYDGDSLNNFNKIRVEVNNILRATGLRFDTPSTVLDQVFGTNLLKFAHQGIIVNGLKMLHDDPSNFGRQNVIVNLRRFTPNTYMHKFANMWNFDFSGQDRRDIMKFKFNFSSIKNFLKKKRKLKRPSSTHVDYKWVDMRRSF